MRHVTHMNESCHTYECVVSHIWMSQDTQTCVASDAVVDALDAVMSHMNEAWHTYE